MDQIINEFVENGIEVQITYYRDKVLVDFHPTGYGRITTSRLGLKGALVQRLAKEKARPHCEPWKEVKDDRVDP